MADTWTLVTPNGDYTLNPTFSAPKYQPGGVSGPGALRRDERTAYQRSGDGHATPGPLVLQGRVWRDDQDTALMVTELNAIRDAVTDCTSVVRQNYAGAYTYNDLAGGASPIITPDGLGGWSVQLDLWPARAEPTFTPATPGIPTFIASATASSDPAASVTTGALSFPPQAQPGDFAVLRMDARSTSGIPTATVGIDQPGWVTQQGQHSLIGGAAFISTKTLTALDLAQPITFSMSGFVDAYRYRATVLIFRANGPITILGSNSNTAPNNHIAPSVIVAETGLRLAFWTTEQAASYTTDGWTPPPGVTTLFSGTNPSTSPGGVFKFTQLMTSDTVPAGPTGTLTASQANGFTPGGAPFWRRAFTLVIGEDNA